MRRGTVNPTARWPERLEHLAALLRAEALAVVSATPGPPSTVFAHHLDTSPDWLATLGDDVFARAEHGPFVTPVPAGTWIEGAGFAVVAPIDGVNGQAVLCALRQEFPFDLIDGANAASASRLLEMSALEGRTLAETLRQSAGLEERLQVLAGIGDELAHARDASALLARAAQEVASRMGAGAASIMTVEGDRLRLRASVGLPSEVTVGREQSVGEGVAGWVVASGEKMVLRGAVDDVRFRGIDPDAGESVVVPLREGSEVLGVLNVKRPDGPDGFADRHELLDAIATDIGRALRAMNLISAVERERADAFAYADVAGAVAAGDVDSALRAALQLGHHAVALRDRAGHVFAVRTVDDDPECRESAITASATAHESSPGGVGVGFARHGGSYQEAETDLAQRAADTLALLGRSAAPLEGTSAPDAARGALRVLAVEDHPVMRLGVRAMLEREGFVVAGTTATCAEALGLIAEGRPDVVLLDLRLPDATGAEAVIRMREAEPALPIVAFSVDRTPALVRAVLRAGANGYVTKDAPVSRLVAAIHAAASGLVALGPDEAIAAVETPLPIEPVARDATAPNGDAHPVVHAPETVTDAPHEAMTPRELELLRYMAEGYTNKELARAMVLAEDTVKKAVQTLIAKLGAADRTHAVVIALRTGLID
ncbi:MAG TPA: response regulator [Candidatus Limnocylindrales bacterium]|nr:response regulator [Candidatus Limnocylindrales bacterium]